MRDGAYEELVIENAHRGKPIYVWKDGEQVEVSPEELRKEAARIEAE